MKKETINARTLLFLGMVLLFLFWPTRIFAYESEIDGLKYEWTNTHDTYGREKIKLIGYNSSKIKEDLTIPTTVKWVSNDSRNKTQCVVNEVAAGAFKGCSKLISVNYGVLTRVYSNTFENCTSLKSIILSYVGTINQYAFKGCSSLIEIHIGTDTPPSVYEDSFDEETYKNATLFVPEGKIETYRANEIWNKFEKISDGTTAPREYTLSITARGNGYALFNGMTIRSKTGYYTLSEGTSATITFSPDDGYQIKSVTVNGLFVSWSNNQYIISNINQDTVVEVEFSDIFEVNGLYFKIISNNQVEVTNHTNYKNCTGSLVIPDKVKYSGKEYVVIAIGQSAFSWCDNFNGSLEIPNSVTSIGDCAFMGCGFIGTLTIPNSVTSIGKSAFSNCVNFTGSLTIPNSVTSIGESAFYGCEGFDGTLSISPKVTSIKKQVFYKCSGFAGSLVIPNSVIEIGEGAFEYCEGFIGSLTLPNSVSNIGENAFAFCYGFTGTLTLPNNITSLKEGAFSGCKFTGLLTIPNSVNDIGQKVFQSCSGLTSLIIPNNVASIGLGAFDYCINITHVKSFIEAPYNINAFNYISSSAILEVPKGTKANYQTLSGWSNPFKEIIEFGNTSTYTLSITASGNGSASYGGTTIRSKTSSFTVNAGSSAMITFTPDNGYRIKSVKVNNTAVSVSNSQYTISSINANTTVSVEFEAIPVTTYTLSITASGNGSASYGGTTFRSKTSSFTVNAGSSATITFSPDNGYRIKSVKVNNIAVSVSNNQYTISSINSNTTVSVEFEVIPPTTYTLSITASGNGSASYGGNTIRSKTSSFTVNQGSSATISFTPDNGYRIKTVKVNNSTVSVSNNQYTISSINANTTVSVEFEAIPVTTYTLSIIASGNGSASYGGTTIRSKTTSFTVNEGTSATIIFTPDNGYRIKSVKVNNTAVSVSNNQYIISSINSNTTVSVEFEAIPPTTYTLSITASGNGSASYSSTTIRNKTTSFTVNEGTSATITFTPDNGYKIKSVKVNNSTVSVSNNQYTISSINGNTTVSVEFEAITYTLSITASGNGSASYGGTTIRSKTSSFTVNSGSSATITFTPDN